MFLDPMRRLSPILIFLALTAPMFADELPAIAPSGAVFIPSAAVLGYVEQDAVKDDLQLSSEQQARISELQKELQAGDAELRARKVKFDIEACEAQSNAASGSLAGILTADQCRRHRQIVLQHVLVRFGLVQFLKFPEVLALLELDEGQQRQFDEIVAGTAYRDRPAQEFADSINDGVTALLTNAQKQRLLASLGAPLAVHLSGSPPAIRSPGAAKQFSFPRIPILRNQGGMPRIGHVALAQHPLLAALLTENSVREELGLTPERFRQTPPFTGHPDDSRFIATELHRWLDAAQLERVKQLALQMVERDHGRPALFEIKEVAEGVGLSEEQIAQLAGVLRENRHSTRRAILEQIERDGDLRVKYDEEAARRLEALLTPRQRAKLAELTGEAFHGKLAGAALGRTASPRASLRGRVAPSLGYLASMPAGSLSLAKIQDALQIGEEQLPRGMERSAGGFSGGLFRPYGALDSPAEEILSRSLTAPQVRRYAQIVLRGSIKSLGPAGIFRYQPVIDALSLSRDQRRRLLAILWDDTRRYLEIPVDQLAAGLPGLNKQTARELDAILSEEQRAQLFAFLGDPIDRLDDADDGPAHTAAPPAAGPSDTSHRVVHPVRHGTAADLARLIRQRYKVSEMQISTDPVSHTLLLAASESLVRDAQTLLSQIDRPRRTVDLHVFVAETDPQRDDGPPIDNSEFTGPIDQIAEKLEGLCREKKLAGFRRIRLSTLEGLDVQANSDTETALLSATDVGQRGPARIPMVRQSSVGIVVHARPHFVTAEHVVVDVALRNSRTRPREDEVEIELGPDGPVSARTMLSESVAATLRIPLGEGVVVNDLETDAPSPGRRLVVIFAAQVARENPQPPAAAALPPVEVQAGQISSDAMPDGPRQRFVHPVRNRSARELEAILERHFQGRLEIQTNLKQAEPESEGLAATSNSIPRALRYSGSMSPFSFYGSAFPSTVFGNSGFASSGGPPALRPARASRPTTVSSAIVVNDNCLALAAPAQVAAEAARILARLDRPVRSVIVDVLLAERSVPGTDALDPGLDDERLQGPIETVVERLESLRKQQKLSSLRRFRLECEAGRANVFNINTETPRRNGFTAMGGGALVIPTVQQRSLGTYLQVTPHFDESGRLLVDLSFRDDRLGDHSVFLGNSPAGPVVSPDVLKTSFGCTVPASVGRASVVNRQQFEVNQERNELCVIVAARPSDAAPAAQSPPAKRTETSTRDLGATRRLVYPERYVPANELAEILTQQFRDEAVVQAMTNPVGTCLVAAPRTVLDEVTKAISVLDRPLQTVIVDVLLVERAAWEGAAADHGVDDSVLTGPIEQVIVRLESLQKQKRLDIVKQMRLETIENQVGQFQLGAERPRINGYSFNGTTGNGTATVQQRAVGTIVQVTPRVLDGNRARLQIIVRDDRMGATDESVFLIDGAYGPIVSPLVMSTNLNCVVTTPIGQAVVANRFTDDSRPKQKEVWLVVAARLVPSPALPPQVPASVAAFPTPPADPDRTARFVHAQRYAATHELAQVLAQQFQGEAEFQSVTEPIRDALLVSTSRSAVAEVKQTLAQLDRPPQNIVVDAVLIEAAIQSDTNDPTLDERELKGPLGQVMARLDELSRQKRVTVLAHAKLDTLENHTGSMQIGEERPRINGYAMMGRKGIGSPTVQQRAMGTVVSVTPRLIETNQALLGLIVRDDRLSAPEDAAFLIDGVNGPVLTPQVLTVNFQGTLSVALGQMSIAGRFRQNAQMKPNVRYLLIAARTDADTGSKTTPPKNQAADQAANQAAPVSAPRSNPAPADATAALEEVIQTLTKLDRPPQTVIVDAVLIETSPREAGAPGPGLDEGELVGPLAQVMSHVEDLKRQKRLGLLVNLQLEIQENRLGTCQFGAEKPRVNGFSMSGTAGIGTPTVQQRSVGTIVSVTPRLVDGIQALLQLAIRDDRLSGPEEAGFLVEGAGAPIVSPIVYMTNLTGTYRAPVGHTVIASRFQRESQSKPIVRYVLVAARPTGKLGSSNSGPAEHSATAEPRPPSKPAGQTQQIEFPVQVGSAGDLADVLNKHFRGTAVVEASSDPRKNVLQVMPGPPTGGESSSTAAGNGSQRPARKIVIDIVTADVVAAAKLRDGVEPLGTPPVDLSNLTGPIDVIIARLEALGKQKQIANFETLRFETSEHQLAERQTSDEVGRINGFTSSGVQGVIRPVQQIRGVGTVIQVTPYLVDANTIGMALAIRKDRLGSGDESTPLGTNAAGQPVASQIVFNASLSTSLTVPIGQAVVVGRSQADPDSKLKESLMIVAARFVDETATSKPSAPADSKNPQSGGK